MGFKETEIGLIPNDWELSNIGKSCEIVMGQSPAGKTYNEKGIGKPFLQGKAEFGYIYPTHKKHTSNPLKIGAENTVLLSVRAPVGDVNLAQIEYCIGRGLSSLSLKQGDNKFLFYLLQFIKPSIAREGTGSTFKAITKPKLLSIKIPLPPLKEQKKIAYVLSVVQEAREKTEAVIQAVRELKKSLMKYLFTYGPVPVEEADKVKLKETEIGMIPEEWEVKPVGTICEIIIPGRDKPKCFDGNIPWITFPDIGETIYIEKSKSGYGLSEKEIKKVKAKIIPSNCVIMSCVGKFGIVVINKCNVVINQQFHAFRCPDSMDSYFLTHALKMQKSYMEKIAHFTTIRYLNKNKCNSIPIPILSLKEQENIVQKLTSIDEKLACEQSKKQALDELFKSLLNNLMTGKIRVNNRNFDGELK